MSHQKLYLSFMAVIQFEVSIHAVYNKCGSQSRQIKDLITKFEYAQQDRISNKQKKLIENSNQNKISRWSYYHIHCKLGHQSYTEWEIQPACSAKILFKYNYPVIFNKYGVPKPYLTRDLRKIYPLLQIRNLNHLQKRFLVGGISLFKVR